MLISKNYTDQMKTNTTTTPRIYKLTVYVAACPYLATDEDTAETLKDQAIEALSYADKITPVSDMRFVECALADL